MINPGLDETTYHRLCSGEQPPAMVRTGTPYTMDELRAAIEPAITAWMIKPSGPGFDALAAAAKAVVDSGRPVPAVGDMTADQVLAKLTVLETYPASDQILVQELNELRSLVPGIPAVIGDGTYRVGVDIQPGRYRAGPVGDCYWETLNDAGEINDNNFVTSAPQVIATVRSGDFAVNFDGCGLFVKIS